MAELINTNVFSADKKFVDFAGLDYFWEKAKAYVDNVDTAVSARVKANEDAIASIQDELNSLSGGAGSIATQIDNAIARLDLPNTYEAKGAAATALDEAKVYADRLADDYDAAGTAAGLDAAMDARVKVLEAIDHSKLASDAAAAAVATVLDDAPEAFDTLKEVAEWIANNDHATDVATLMTDVAGLKAIDHDAYVAADETVLASANAYTDSKVDGKFDTVGSAAAAESAAKTYADGVAATAKSEAIADADGKLALKANSADVYVKDTVDTKVSAAEAAAIAQAKLDAADALKAYYTKTEVDNLLTTNSTGDRAYAKQYTDELFGSFKFAANSDIDALFA